jgi:hypothetical protein
MLNLYIIGTGVLAVIIFIGIVYVKGITAGKREATSQPMEDSLNDVTKVNKRRYKRFIDGVGALYKRMRKYTRD